MCIFFLCCFFLFLFFSSIATKKSSSSKSGREWSAVQVLSKELPHIKDLDARLAEGEEEYASLFGTQYTIINFLRWFLKNKAGVVDPTKCVRLVDLYMDEFLHFKVWAVGFFFPFVFAQLFFQ